MKLLLNFFSLGALIIILALNSCKKNKNAESDPLSTPTNSLNTVNLQTMIRSLSTPTQSLTINAGAYTNLMLFNGTQIVIAPNSFLNASGTVITGTINIEAKDVLSKKDMILNNAFPVSNGQLLTSGGEVYFNATQGGQKLKINPAGSVSYGVPAGSLPSYSMLKFYSYGTEDLSTTNLNWITSSTAESVLPALDSLGSSWIYSFNSDSIGWTNIDYFYSFAGTKTTCKLNLTGAFNNSNTMVSISLNGTQTLLRLSGDSWSSISQGFNSGSSPIFPVGLNYTIVAISFDGTNYYYGSLAITMTSDMIINMPPLTLSSKAAIETNLSLLP